MLKKYGLTVLSDLSPMYVLQTIQGLEKELYVSKMNPGNMFLHILLRCFLSPKQVIVNYRLNKDIFDYVVQQVKLRFYEAIAHPSEMVGVVAAQSIGEPCTQMTLNTFHSSGISSASKAVRGVPRIKELLSVTKNIKAPSMIIHLKDEVKRDKMKSNSVLKSIQTTFFKDIVKSSKIYFDPDDFNTDIEDDKLFLSTYKEFVANELYQTPDVSPWLLRIEIDREKLLEEGINMLSLYTILQEYYDQTISCMFSDDNSNNLVFRIKLQESNEEDRDYITELKALEKNILENTIIKGIKNVNKAMMNKQEQSIYNQETMSFEKTMEWVIDTSGTNMIDVMCHPEVDYTKTVSNDINEIYELLGIEAARNALYNELHGVIASAELYVNYRHLALLVDTMTNRGYLLSIDRHGINRVDFGPLAKCSFEETTDMLIKAGIFSEVDRINGVSANIMLGQIPPCGTGDCDVLIDEHKLINTLASMNEVDTDDTNEYKDVCTIENLAFDFQLPQNAQHVSPISDFDLKFV
jgi:DNA-directed RNA polymerase II subunit RPB1